jgi:hypothetical protein
MFSRESYLHFLHVIYFFCNLYQNSTVDPNLIEAGHLYDSCCMQCGEACEYEKIDTKLSHAQFPAPTKVHAFTTYLNRVFNRKGLNFTDDETRQLSLFEMYYEMKEHRVIEKVTKTSIEELISNLGGALGVWTGLSMLSFYQMLIYVLKGFCSGKRASKLANPTVEQIIG